MEELVKEVFSLAAEEKNSRIIKTIKKRIVMRTGRQSPAGKKQAGEQNGPAAKPEPGPKVRKIKKRVESSRQCSGRFFRRGG